MMFVVRVIRHQLGTMAAALRALVALVVISSFAHIDAFSPAPALWGVGKSSVMGSRTLGRSGMRPRGAKMAVSQDVDQELKAKQEAEMKAILEKRKEESLKAGDPMGLSTTKPSTKPLDLLFKWSWGMRDGVSSPATVRPSSI
jgi:hypothetical protein